MKLYILRHGEAVAQAAEDAQRPLTAVGIQEVLSSAVHLMAEPPTKILASPYLRTQQTAARVAKVLGIDVIETAAWLTPDSSVTQVLQHLKHYRNTPLLLVSHQPLVSYLLMQLLGGAALPMRTASLAMLQGEPVAAGMQLQALHHVS